MNGHLIALVGGRAFCAGCGSIGFIAKAGGLYRPGFCGAEQVLEGDVVVCGCPVPHRSQHGLPMKNRYSLCSLIKIAFVFVISTFISIDAFACSYYAGVGIYFDKNSALISAHEMKRLAEWAADIHETYPGADSLEIEVVNEIGETDGQSLGKKRELSLRLALVDLNITAPVVRTSEKFDAWPENYFGKNVKRADVSYHPVAPFHRLDCNPVPIKAVD